MEYEVSKVPTCVNFKYCTWMSGLFPYIWHIADWIHHLQSNGWYHIEADMIFYHTLQRAQLCTAYKTEQLCPTYPKCVHQCMPLVLHGSRANTKALYCTCVHHFSSSIPEGCQKILFCTNPSLICKHCRDSNASIIVLFSILSCLAISIFKVARQLDLMWLIQTTAALFLTSILCKFSTGWLEKCLCVH